MRLLLQVGPPRLEKSPTTRHAPNDLVYYFLKLITNESPTTSGAPTTREEPNYKTCSQRPCALFFLKLMANERPTASGAPMAREEPNYKTCSQRPCSLVFEVDSEGEPDRPDNQIVE